MPKRENQIITYVTDSEQREIQAHAQAEEQSASEWLREAASLRIEQEGLESASSRYEVEDRLLDLVDQAASEAAEQIVEELKKEEDIDIGIDEETIEWGE
jgi:hypothetical protein